MMRILFFLIILTSMVSCQSVGLFGTKESRELKKEERKEDLRSEIEMEEKNMTPVKTKPAVRSLKGAYAPKQYYDK